MKLRSVLFLVVPSFILGALVMSLVLINYDLLGWENTELYKSVKQYGIDNYSYVEDVHDCSEISQEMAQITEDLGFNATVITVVEKDRIYNHTALHAIIEVPIWIDNNGHLLAPNEKYVLYGEVNKWKTN